MSEHSHKLGVVGGEAQPASSTTEFALLNARVDRHEYTLDDPDGRLPRLERKAEELSHSKTAIVTAISVVTFVLGMISTIAAVLALAK